MRVVVYRDKSDCRRTEAMRAIGYNRIRLLFVCLFFVQNLKCGVLG